MSAPQPRYVSHYLKCAGREIHCLEWGAGQDQTVVAWHGLARTARDMDELAERLSGQGFRVLCPDLIGRGLSQWSPQPAQEYCLDFYARIAEDFFVAMNIRKAHWVGTSMGGALGMVCASGLSQPALKSKILSLTLNDTAPQVAASAIARIRSYAGSPPAFQTMNELEKFFRQVYLPYGFLTDSQWRRLTESSTRRLPDGRVTPHYDPAMVQQFVHYPDDYLIWQHYDEIEVPTLCLRGEHSDLVERETVSRMRLRGPGASGRLTVEEIPDCGHAPALNVASQLDLVARFIEEANQLAA